MQLHKVVPVISHAPHHTVWSGRLAFPSALRDEGGAQHDDLGDEIEPHQRADQRRERCEQRIAGGAGQQSRAEQLHHRNRQGTRRRADQRESSGFDVATTRNSSMNKAKFSATPVQKPVSSSSRIPGSELLAMPLHCNTRRTMPPDTVPAAVERMNSIAMAMAASVSRNLATTILSSSPQSSNIDRPAWRSEFIQPVTVHQNMANVARPVHVNVLDMVFSAEDAAEQSRPHRE